MGLRDKSLANTVPVLCPQSSLPPPPPSSRSCQWLCQTKKTISTYEARLTDCMQARPRFTRTPSLPISLPRCARTGASSARERAVTHVCMQARGFSISGDGLGLSGHKWIYFSPQPCHSKFLGGTARARARARVCVCGLGATVVVCGESDKPVVGLCEALASTV